ncbi:HesA/MoeB/ThiF family protein [Laceyella putida]|uniref:HesA/MoeB/ThiF family protein n=1 Tax=Laceyella putida TaxID=110101 RepID=A0ABW2RQM5_9BACL
MISLKAKPKKKKAYPCVSLDNHIYIAGFGSINKYEDPNGAVGELIALMDGERTVEEIANTISAKYEEITFDMVVEAIADLSQDRIIEDTAFVGSEILSEYQLERYHRNINFFSTYATLEQNKYQYQKKLCEAKVCVVGLGGLGSHIVFDLAGLGVGTIRAIEFDRVERSNLNRQILYTEADIGQKKASIAEQRINMFNPSIHFETLDRQITSANDAFEAINGFDYCILVADRPKTKIALWFNEACVKAGVTLISGGLEAQRAMHYTVIPHVTGCIQCWVNQVKKRDPISYAILEERRRLNLTGDNTAIVPLVSVCTGLMLAELVRLITGVKPSNASGKMISIDFETMTTSVAETWEKDANCEVCGRV